jgi:hypothetical protein
MTERLGIGVIPGVGWSAAEVQAVAREAEDAGFDAIFDLKDFGASVPLRSLRLCEKRQLKQGSRKDAKHRKERKEM